MIKYIIIILICIASIFGYIAAEKERERWSHCYYVIQGQERNYISETYPYRLKHSSFSEIKSLDGTLYADSVSIVFTVCDQGLIKNGK